MSSNSMMIARAHKTSEVRAPCVVIHTEDSQVPRFVERVKSLEVPGAPGGVRVLAVAAPLIYVQAIGVDSVASPVLNTGLRVQAEGAFGSGRIAAHRVYQLDWSCSDPMWIPHSQVLIDATERSNERIVVRVVAFPRQLQAKIMELLVANGITTHPTQFTHELFVTAQSDISSLHLFGLVERSQQQGRAVNGTIHKSTSTIPSTRAEAPCRAFFKLHECLQHHFQLAPGAHVLDVGASPGGWTESLLRHGARVVAVDPGELTIPLACRPVVHIQSLLENALPQLARMERFTLAVCDINVRVSEMATLMQRVAPLLVANARVVFTLKLGKKPKPAAVDHAFQLVQRVLSPDFHTFQLIWLHANTQNERTLLARKR